MKRDGNSVQDYYRAWDNFNVDEELERVDKEEPPKKLESFKNVQQGLEKAKTKIQVSGKRIPPGYIEEEVNEINKLTDQVYDKTDEIKKETEDKIKLNQDLQKNIDKVLQETKQKEEEIKRVEQEKQIMLQKIKEMEELLQQNS